MVLLSLPLPRLLLSLKASIISSRGIVPEKSHQEPMTAAARVDSSDRECLIFETVSPPHEKALSTSVDIATQDSQMAVRRMAQYLKNTPGTDKKSMAMR